MKTEQIQLPDKPPTTPQTYNVQGHKLWRLRALTTAVLTGAAVVSRLVVRVTNTASGEDRMVVMSPSDMAAGVTFLVQGSFNLPASIAPATANEQMTNIALPDVWQTLDGLVSIDIDGPGGYAISSTFITLEYDD